MSDDLLLELGKQFGPSISSGKTLAVHPFWGTLKCAGFLVGVCPAKCTVMHSALHNTLCALTGECSAHLYL